MTKAQPLDSRSVKCGYQAARTGAGKRVAKRKSPRAVVRQDIIRDAIINSMEQGILVWGPDDKCAFINERLHHVLELRDSDLAVGMDRKEFVRRCEGRGEQTSKSAEEITEATERGESFSFERYLRSGRTVAITARPLPQGGHVVTFTDVTDTRKLVLELEDAKQAAEIAKTQSQSALTTEKRRQKQIHMLSRLGEWLQSCKSLDELYDVVTAHMVRMLPGTTGELYIYSNSRDVLDGACYWGEVPALDHIHADDCWSLRRGRSYVYGTDDVEFVCGHVDEQDCSDTWKGYFCIPIVAHGDTVGLLHVKMKAYERELGFGEFSSIQDMRTFAIQCAEQISLAVANVKLRDQLRDQSIRDPLTGLFNRRYLLEALRSEIGRSIKKDKPLSIISFDADHFKRFNDNHGHDAGDAVLRSLGELLRKLFGADEVNCRFGGEEFVVMLPETDLETAQQRAEDLRASVENLKLRYGEHTLPSVSISIGVASLSDECSDPQSLISAADTAMYRAKDDGRNRVNV
ncbi:MAG: diguanylate cyclase [Pseudomonadota bacterium]